VALLARLQVVMLKAGSWPASAAPNPPPPRVAKPLRHDALAAELTRLAEYCRTVLLVMLIEDDVQVRTIEELGEHRFDASRLIFGKRLRLRMESESVLTACHAVRDLRFLEVLAVFARAAMTLFGLYWQH
jgi:hypothetical protein